MSTVEIQLIMNIFSQHFNICFVWFFLKFNSEIKPFVDKGMNEIVLDVQFGMQVVQAILTLVFMFVPPRSSR